MSRIKSRTQILAEANEHGTDFDEIAPSLRTGDLALFHGSSWISRTIQRVTGSPFSHVGMIVRYDDIVDRAEDGRPPRDGMEPLEFRENGRPLTEEELRAEVWFFESTLASESLPSLLDEDRRDDEKPHSGVQLVKLRDAFCYYDCQKYGTFNVRQLFVDDPAALDYRRLREFMNETNKKPFPALVVLLAHWITGLLGLPAQLNSYFCAELVAMSYNMLGLLNIDCRQNPANQYSPKRFSAGFEGLHLRLGAFLKPEVIVTVRRCPGDSAGGKEAVMGLARIRRRLRSRRETP